jgi:hypothetical protein
VLLIVAGGLIANWIEGGDEAALTLPAAATFDNQVLPDEAPERELVKHCIDVLRALAWVRIGAEDREGEVGKALLALTIAVLNFGEQQIDLAITLSLLSRGILDRLGDPDARRAQLYAYRLLVAPRRLPFLPDLPPAKFPPPMPPTFDEDVLLDTCLHFIEQGVIAQDVDLGAIAADMRADPETVIHNTLHLTIDGQLHQLKVELSFSSELIDWAFNADDWTDKGVGAHWKLRAYLSILCDNRELLERSRDDDFGLICEMIYIGIEDEASPRLGQAMKIESFTDNIRCVVGIDVGAVRTSGARDQGLAMHRDRLLAHIKREVEAA